jgi:hypothetical protein
LCGIKFLIYKGKGQVHLIHTFFLLIRQTCEKCSNGVWYGFMDGVYQGCKNVQQKNVLPRRDRSRIYVHIYV